MRRSEQNLLAGSEGGGKKHFVGRTQSRGWGSEHSFSPELKYLYSSCRHLDEKSGWKTPRCSFAALVRENTCLTSAGQTHLHLFAIMHKHGDRPVSPQAGHAEARVRWGKWKRREGREDESGSDAERRRRSGGTEGDINSDQLNNEGVLMALPNYNQACH